MDSQERSTFSHTNRSDGRPWYHDPRFNSYWKHHHEVFSWFDHHKLLAENQQKSNEEWSKHCQQVMQMWWWQCMQYSMSQMPNPHPFVQEQPRRQPPIHTFKVPGPPVRVKTKVKPAVSPVNQLNQSKRSRKRATSKSSRKERKRRNRSRSASARRRSEQEEEDEEEDMFCDINIDEDLLKFLSVSAKHRKERDARKKEDAKEGNCNEHAMDFDTSCKGTSAAPKERPGLRRTAEMKMLYGKGAAMIHGMETAMQLTFDRNVDIKQPRPWPNLPIHIKFE